MGNYFITFELQNSAKQQNTEWTDTADLDVKCTGLELMTAPVLQVTGITRFTVSCRD